MQKIPDNLKGGQFWHVIYEGRFAIILIAPNADGFFAHGQDCVWSFDEVTEWINEIPVAHSEYGYDYEHAYCLSCGSCGETGCCSPTKCEAVKCAYGESNLKDYKQLNEAYQIMWEALEELSKQTEPIPNCDPSAFTPTTTALIAKNALTRVSELY